MNFLPAVIRIWVWDQLFLVKNPQVIFQPLAANALFAQKAFHAEIADSMDPLRVPRVIFHWRTVPSNMESKFGLSHTVRHAAL